MAGENTVPINTLPPYLRNNYSSFVLSDEVSKAVEGVGLPDIKETINSYVQANQPVGTNSVLAPKTTTSAMVEEPGFFSELWGEAGKLDDNGNYTGGSGIAGVVNNASLMKNLTGLGSLGLGLANYFQNKGLLDLQKRGLEQNIAFANEDQSRQRTNRQSAANYEYRDRTGVA